jgi:formate dehydrogenase alpha subunit
MSKQQKITAIIDGEPVQVPRGQTVLDAAQKAGIYIPTLCYLEQLKPYGGCRLCMVEIKGWKGFPTACTTPIEPGMEIRTKTPELQSLRGEILELTLSEHPYTCLVCRDKKECTDFMHTTRKSSTITGCNFCTSNGDCELQELIDYLDLQDVKFPISYRGIPTEKKNPFYDLDYNLCVLCGRCVRICNEERNSHVLAFVKRGNSTIVGTAFNESQIEAGCEFCGACVDVCPTGSISEKMGKWAGLPSQSRETTCVLCSVGCTMNVNTRGSRIVNVGARPGGRTNPLQLCLRGKFLPGDISHHPSRITTPLIRRNGKWVEVDWKEAIRFTASKLETHSGARFGIMGSAQDTLEDNYALQKFARAVMRSNNVDLYASYPDKELVRELRPFLSSFQGKTTDLDRADTMLILGANASVSHPLIENRVRKAFNLGRNILYANPHPTRTSKFASLEINYAPGGEYNFLHLLAARLAGDIKSAKQAATNHADLEAFTDILVKSRYLAILLGDDMLRNGSGRDVLRTLGYLISMKRDNARASVLLLGYEGNLFAGALAGAHPDVLPGFDPVTDRKALQKWNRHWNARIDGSRGLSCNEMLDSIGKDGVSALMISGDIPQHPKLRRLKFLVQLNMFKTGLSEHADVFLPLTDFLETEGHVMTLEGNIKRLSKILPGQGNSKTVPAILSLLAREMHASGHFGPRPAILWREFEGNMKQRESETLNETVKLHSLKALSQKGKAEMKLTSVNHYDHYRYRGNCLTELVPDLQTVVKWPG